MPLDLADPAPSVKAQPSSKQKGKWKLTDPTPKSAPTVTGFRSKTGLKLIIKKHPQNDNNGIYSIVNIVYLTNSNHR